MRNKSVRKIITFSLAVGLLFFSSVNIMHAAASEATDTISHIYDNAALLSSSEKNDLEDKCITYGDDAGMNIFILTHDDSDTPDGEVYIEDFFDNNLSGKYNDSIILLIDMARRDVIIETYGTTQTYVHSQRTDQIISKITPYLSDGDYVKAFETYIESSASYMKDKSDPNYSRNYTKAPETLENDSSPQETILTNIFFQLAAALAIGAIAVVIMAYNAGGKMTASGNTYMEQNNSGLIGRRDDYIRTTVTRVRRPQNNSSGGGFHGGISAGGASHGTSRGKF